VPVSPAEPQYPVVLYSHGDQLTRTDNTRRVENLVSFGFVVVAVDHWNCAVTVFPDGRRLNGLQIPDSRPGDPLTMQVATNRAHDMHFMLEEIARWNDGDPLLRGRLDLDHVGMFGMSFGGGTTTHACQDEALIKVGVTLDGGYESFPIPTVDRPFLIVSGGDNDAFMKQFRDAFRNLFDRLNSNAYWVRIKDSIHCDFNDTVWFDAPTSLTRTRRALLLDHYVVSFLRKYLRDEDDRFLDGPPVDWPEADQFLKK
jgi:predicted dienelactone hydrolase